LANKTDPNQLIQVGDFRNYTKNDYNDGVGGKVFIKDEKTLVIKRFNGYLGPDVFFMAGTSQVPSYEGTILPYPFKGKFYEYEDPCAPPLKKDLRCNKEEIV
jgi:hypothetical protein